MDITDITIESYKEFIKQEYDRVNSNPRIRKKIKKAFKSFKKQVDKLDEDMFMFLLCTNYEYILSSTMNKPKSIFDNLENIKFPNDKVADEDDNGIDEDDSKMHNGLYENHYNRPKMHLRIIDDSDFEINKNEDLIFPPELTDMHWAMKGPMELTIASNGTMWMNSELWKYLIEMIQIEMYGNMPKIFQPSETPSEISINIGYNKNHLLISLTKQLSRCMEVTFNENINSYNEPYGTADDNTCMKLQIETSFNIKGKYVFRPTNIFGLLYGEKV